MVTLKGVDIYLRALEPDDLEFIYKVENDERVWEVSNTQTPYSRFLIKQYLENAHLDIYEAKQLRLAICNYKNEVIGLIDLFDFNPAHRRAGVGILILNPEERGKGYGKEALKLVLKYGQTHLNLHQVYASITEDNIKSIDLFTKTGFKYIGQRKDWTLVQGVFKNENLYQYLYVH